MIIDVTQLSVQKNVLFIILIIVLVVYIISAMGMLQFQVPIVEPPALDFAKPCSNPKLEVQDDKIFHFTNPFTDKQSELNLRHQETCDWTPYSAPNDKKFSMCLRPAPCLLSDVVRRSHSWPDCNIIPVMYQHLVSFNKNMMGAQAKYFLDVGGNLGACSFTMAVQDFDLRVVAFEPVNSNQFYYKNTVIRNRFDNIDLVQCGAAATEGNSTIYIGPNKGDSRILTDDKKFQNAEVRRQHYEPEVICLASIDKIMLSKEQGIIPVMKMDIQGFEYFALLGAKSIFTNPATAPWAIKTEFAPWLLQATNIEPVEMLNLLDEYGYDIYDDYQQGKSSCLKCPFQNKIEKETFVKFANKFQDQAFTDIYALRSDLN
eukprot:970303_1